MNAPVTTPLGPTPAEPRSAAALEVGAELLQGSLLVLAVAVLLIAWLLSTGARKALEFAWKTGVDPERRLGLAKLVFDLGLATSVLWLGLRNVAELAPGSSSLAVALVALFIGVGVYPELQNLMAGLSIRGAEQLRRGDIVSMGDVHGAVLQLGLTHIDVRVGDGSIVFVPNRFFRGRVVKVERERKVWPISVRLNGKFSLDEIDRLKIAGMLCPFRNRHTEVTVEHGAAAQEGFEDVVVKLSCWSEAAAQHAVHYIEQLASSGTTLTVETP